MSTFFIFLISFISSGEMTPEEKTSSEATEISEEIQQTDEMTTYYFIRHAEKDERDPQNKDPFLTEAGLKRARNWAEIFEDVEFDLIFTSDYNRTRKTAEAVANSQGKEVEIYDAKDLNNEHFKKKTLGKTVLVVGHSNTNPAFVNAILEEKRYEALAETEYGSLFVVNIAADGTKDSQVLYIN